MHIAQRKLSMSLALVCLVFSMLAISVLHSPHAFAGGVPDPTPMPTQPPVVPGPGALTTITITQSASVAKFEFTPYRLTIALDVKGIRIKNMTNQTQVVLSDSGVFGPLLILAHHVQEVDLVQPGTYPFHLKETIPQPAELIIVKADPA